MHWCWRGAIAIASALIIAVPIMFTVGRGVDVFGIDDDWGAVLFLLVPWTVVSMASIGAWVYLSHRFPLWATPDGETRCRRCGYILRGISEPRCPECGEVI
jgi:hypothetical protein